MIDPNDREDQMIDIEPVISDQELRLYETLNTLNNDLETAATDYYKALRLLDAEAQRDAAVILADTYCSWRETLDKVAHIQAEKVVTRCLGGII